MRILFLLFCSSLFADRDLIENVPWSIAGARLDNVPAEGSPGGSTMALRVNTANATPSTPWDTQLSARVPGPLPRGRWLRFRLWARSPGSNRIGLVHELGSAPFSKSLDYTVRLKPEWQEIGIPYPSAAYEANASSLRIRLGFDAGTVEVAGMQLENWEDEVPPPVNFDPYGGQPHDDQWRAPANERIARYRMGNLRVRVVDQAGAPVSGARIEVEQKRHAFLFGTALADGPLLGGNADAIRYRETFLKLFNYAVLENALKWGFRNGDFTPADRMLSWLADRGIPVRGHTLFWPSYQYMPESVRALRGPALRQAVEGHIRDYAARTRDRVVVWDVINEAHTNTEALRDGGRDLLWMSYRWTREMDPAVELAYNDYDISNRRAGANDAHRAGVMAVIRELLANGAPVTVLGDQGHMSVPVTPIPDVLAAWDELARFGLPVEITEVDVTFGGVRDEPKQAEYFCDYMTAAFSHPKVKSFLLWGFWDGAHWLASQGAGMFRSDWSRRPMADVYEDLVFGQWWTRLGGQTASGEWRGRVFLGEHEIRVTKEGSAKSASVSVTANEDATTEVTIRL